MILSCSNLQINFGDITIFHSCNMTIDDHDHIAIVGVNGAGKTTLIKALLGIFEPSDGSIYINKEKKIGYLSQKEPVDSEHTLLDELLLTKKELITTEQELRQLELQMKDLFGSDLEKNMDRYHTLSTLFERNGGYTYMSEIHGVMNGLGFDSQDQARKISTFSGGQKTRVALAKILLESPDLIILDEPTNHLDLESIKWLETYLLNYKGALLVVSHDRFFLDKISNKVLEIDQTNTRMYSGNYSAYAKKKEEIREALISAYMNNKKERERQEAIIEKLKSFNREKSIKRAESREKLLQKMEVLERPTDATSGFHFTLSPSIRSGNDVLLVKELKKQFDTNILFEHVNFEIKRGEHVALLGENGTGKTTLLKILNGHLDSTEGTYKIGTNVEIGYYDQEQQLLNDSNNLFEEIENAYPDMTITKIRNTLAAFSFTGDEVLKKISALSGGERGRLSLAKLMLSNANFLVLDEPTNHLDIKSKEILENAIKDYEGTILYVSHDRYFIEQTATRILELTHCEVQDYPGDYTFYLEQKTNNFSFSKNNTISSIETSHSSEEKINWTQSKESAKEERKRIKKISQAEEKIEHLEHKKEELEHLMALPENCSNSSKLQELNQEYLMVSNELEITEELWMELNQ